MKIKKLKLHMRFVDVIEHGLFYLFGGQPNQLVSKIRSVCLTSTCSQDKLESKNMPNMVQTLKMRQRYSNLVIGENGSYQSRQFVSSLKALRDAGIPILVVYATENPQSVQSLITTKLLKKHRDNLENLVMDIGDGIIYLPPNKNLKKEFYLDSIHLNPSGYQELAKYLFPYLVSATSVD